jgi:hypothetical protein
MYKKKEQKSLCNRSYSNEAEQLAKQFSGNNDGPISAGKDSSIESGK